MSSDRSVLRALAHPTRLQIVDLLRQHPSLTATECATMLQLTPKTCSYHLQTLATNGIVSEIAVSGRNRPWQLTDRAKDPHASVGTDTGAAAARRGARADEVRLRRDETLLHDAADAIAEAAGDSVWAPAVAVHSHPATMTAEELAAWCDDVERLTRRHVRRSSTGADANGSRSPVHLIFFGFPAKAGA